MSTLYGDNIFETNLNILYNSVIESSKLFENLDISINEDASDIKDRIIKTIKNVIQKVKDFIKYIKEKVIIAWKKIITKIKSYRLKKEYEDLEKELKSVNESYNYINEFHDDFKRRIKPDKISRDMIERNREYTSRYEKSSSKNEDPKENHNLEELEDALEEYKNEKIQMYKISNRDIIPTIMHHGDTKVELSEGNLILHYDDHGKECTVTCVENVSMTRIDFIYNYDKYVNHMEEITKQIPSLINFLEQQIDYFQDKIQEMQKPPAPGFKVSYGYTEEECKIKIGYLKQSIESFNTVLTFGSNTIRKTLSNYEDICFFIRKLRNKIRNLERDQ